MDGSVGGSESELSLPLIPPIAQLVEQRPFKSLVLGSNPSGRTKDTNTSPAGGFVLLSETEACYANTRNSRVEVAKFLARRRKKYP